MSSLTLQQAIELALQHHQSGHLKQAESIYRQVLAVQPQNPDALHLLGLITHQTGRHDEAVGLIERAIRSNPEIANFHNSLGEALRTRKDPARAAAAFRRATELDPRHAEGHANLGIVLRTQGDLDGAIAATRRAIELNPRFAEAWNTLGNALRERGEHAQAVEALHQAILLRPDWARAHSNLGAALASAGRSEAAIEAYRRSIALRADFAEAHSNLGNALRDLDRLDEAIVSHRRALEIDSSSAEFHNNLATDMHATGAFDAALGEYDEAIRLRPDYATAHLNRAVTLLMLGDFERGWEEYEWRWRCRGFQSARRAFAQPAWNGADIRGKRILIHAEQGFGDTIQMVRLVSTVAERGADVIVLAPRALRELLGTVAGVNEIVEEGAALPTFDVHIPLMSLPRLLAVRLETIPSVVPYLHADAPRSADWARRVGSARLKVGIAWTGSPANRSNRTRSIPLPMLAPLLEVAGARFYSLQKWRHETDPDRTENVIDFTDQMNDFADAAALIENLDLVITVCTAAAHLAGALGKPTWTLLSRAACWRWMDGRDDSPWYPTMRLFRQERLGDWTPVIRRVWTELTSLARR